MPYPSSSYKGTQRSANVTANDPGSNTVNNFTSALETVVTVSTETNILSAAKYPTDVPQGTVKLVDSTSSLADLNAYLLAINTVLASISTEIGSASATQKSYIEFTNGNDLNNLREKILKANFDIAKLFDTMNINANFPKPGFTEFPDGGARYPSSRNRY